MLVPGGGLTRLGRPLSHDGPKGTVRLAPVRDPGRRLAFDAQEWPRFLGTASGQGLGWRPHRR